DASDDERDDHSRTGLRHRLREHDEDARTDGFADAEHGEQEGSQAALQVIRGPARDRCIAYRPASPHLLREGWHRGWHSVSSGELQLASLAQGITVPTRKVGRSADYGVTNIL